MKVLKCLKQLKELELEDITNYDETLLTFINETSEMCAHLQNRVLELEKKLENNNSD